MRLLAPAVLLAIGALAIEGPGSVASPLPNSPCKQESVSIPSEPSRVAGSPASLLNVASRQVGQATEATPGAATIAIPVGTKVTLALTSPIWAKNAKAGGSVYATTAFPVVSNGRMAIPPGTYVLGQIDAVTKPSWKDAHALFQMHFSRIIFANGYTLQLASAPVQAATATVHVQVTSRNDLLLDNGAQFDMILQSPLALEANRVEEAVRRARPLPLGAPKSATMCRVIPATPGTADTVIPGTPGSSGTPDTVIPGPDGTSTVIPGIPATPGTPPTIIPGSPGMPEIPCPAPPAVVSGPSGPQIHKQSFQVTDELVVSGKKLLPGVYEVAWLGTDAAVQVELQHVGKTIVRVPARIFVLPENSAADKTSTRANPDGSVTIASLEFAGESFAVVFD